MSQSPMHDFLAGSAIDFQPIDVAVLMAAIAYTEKSSDGIISPSFKRRVYFVNAEPDDIEASICSLVACGELAWVQAGAVRGFKVVRYQRWLDLITSFGGRRYAREKARESRERNRV